MTISSEATVVRAQDATNIADWLKLKCSELNFSMRKAAVQAGLSHATLAQIKNGSRPTADTISKLAAAFSNGGDNQKAALEDHLLCLCGYRSNVQIQHNEPVARLMDKLSGLNEQQLAMVEKIIDFCSTLTDESCLKKN